MRSSHRLRACALAAEEEEAINAAPVKTAERAGLHQESGASFEPREGDRC